MYEDEQANVQVYDCYFQEEDWRVWTVMGLEDWESNDDVTEGEQVGGQEYGDGEGTECAGSHDEVKGGSSLLGQQGDLEEFRVHLL